MGIYILLKFRSFLMEWLGGGNMVLHGKIQKQQCDFFSDARDEKVISSEYETT